MSETEIGVYYGRPIEWYRKAPGLSKSQLDLLRDSPEIFKDFQSGRYQPDRTAAMQTGAFVHSLILENRQDFAIQPETIEDENGVAVKWEGRKSICKEWKAKQTQPVVTESESQNIFAMVWACRGDKFAHELIEQGQAEVSLFAERDGRLFKCRPDWVGDDYLVDIKTTQDANIEEFSKEIYKRRYHVQAALYMRICETLGIAKERFYFIAIQKSNPPRINVRQLHESALDIGACELDDDLELLAECEKSGNWFGYSGKSGAIEKIDVPQWAHEKYAARDLALTSGGKAINW